MARTKLPLEALKFFQRAGRRGAKARLEKLTPQKRAEVARTAAKARWAKAKKRSKSGERTAAPRQ